MSFAIRKTFPILARLAPETGTMRLKTSVLLLPIVNAVETAENIATLDHICRVTLKVVAVEEWQSDDAAAGDLHRLLADFERKVRAGPAQVAVGFSSHCNARQRRHKVAMSRRMTWIGNHGKM